MTKMVDGAYKYTNVKEIVDIVTSQKAWQTPITCKYSHTRHNDRGFNFSFTNKRALIQSARSSRTDIVHTQSSLRSY